MRLKDRGAIVTGGATGLGRVFARRLLGEGARTMADATVARSGRIDILVNNAAVSTGQTPVVDGGSIVP